MRWWRNAERANRHPFCSWTRNDAPETKSAPAVTSDQYEETSRPRTTASCTAPAAVAAWAQMECARRCRVENVEKIAINQSQTPAESASDGQRYARQRRRRNTSGPTIASARTTSPKKRNPAANSQWAISALGSISTLGGLEVVDDARRHDECEEEPDEHDEQRRLYGPVPEALPR